MAGSVRDTSGALAGAAMTRHQYARIILALVLMAVFCGGIVSAHVTLSGWNQSTPFIIPSRTEAQSNFPVMLKLSGASGVSGNDTTGIFTTLGSSDLKLAVADESGTQYYVEIEYWDPTNKSAVLWANLSVSSTTPLTYYLYYDSLHADNSNYVGITGTLPAQKVWNGNYNTVLHFSNVTNGYANDSTSNQNYGITHGSVSEVTRDIGKTMIFDGTGTYVNVPFAQITNITSYTGTGIDTNQQGVTHDNNGYHYITGYHGVYKYFPNWTYIDYIASDPNHFGGASSEYNNSIYIAVANLTSSTTFGPSYIYQVNLTTFSFIDVYNISSQFSAPTEGSGAVEYHDGYFYVGVSTFSSSKLDKILKYDNNFNYIQTYTTRVPSYYNVQGIKYDQYSGVFQIDSHAQYFYRINPGFDNSSIQIYKDVTAITQDVDIYNSTVSYYNDPSTSTVRAVYREPKKAFTTNGSFTIMAFQNATGGAGTRRVPYETYHLYSAATEYTTSNTLTFTLLNSSLTIAQAVTTVNPGLNNNYFSALEYNATSNGYQVFYNGNNQTSYAGSLVFPILPIDALNIGTYRNADGRFWVGDISEIQILDTTVSPEYVNLTGVSANDKLITYLSGELYPVASFSGTPLSGQTPFTVTFTDSSINATAYNWSFGDGSYSDLQSPTHTYTTPGNYSVSEMVTGAFGSNTLTKTGYITALPSATQWCAIQYLYYSDAASDVTGYRVMNNVAASQPEADESVTITAASGIVPIDAYLTPAGYPGTVTLLSGLRSMYSWGYVSSTGGTSQLVFNESVLHADGTKTPLFNTTTTGLTATLAQQNTQYIYMSNTTFSATDRLLMNVSAVTTSVAPKTIHFLNGGNAHASYLETSYFVCSNAFPYPTVTTFKQNITQGYIPLTVQFYDTSSFEISRFWDFGDGTNSTDQNPLHTYTSAGQYTVSLTATNGHGSATKTAPNLINALVYGVPAIDFWANTVTTLGQSTGFVDSSTNNPTSWYWSFGDGSTSTTQNPSHTYATYGYYTVNHSATNAYGTAWMNRSNYVAISPPSTSPVIITSFTGTPTSGLASLPVTFTDTSIALPYPVTSWSWNFGDTGTSVLQNPSHTYNTPGTYSVSLTTANTNLTNSTTYTNYIVVTAPIPSSAFVKSITSDATTTSININRYEYGPLSLFNPDTLVPITTAQTITYLGDSTTMDTMAKLPAIAFYGDDGSYWIYRTV